MAENGVRTTDLDSEALFDELLGNRDGSTVRITKSAVANELGIPDLTVRAAALEAQAFADAPIYNTTAAGLSATANGTQFRVKSANADIAYDVYLNDSGSAVLVTSVPSVSALATKADQAELNRIDGILSEVTETVGTYDESDLAFAILDEAAHAGATLSTDGTWTAVKLKSATAEFDEVTSLDDGGRFVWAVSDQQGNVALGVLRSGEVVGLGTGTAAPGTTDNVAGAGSFIADRLYFANHGQSLGEGSNGVLTTVQEYGALGFAARDPDPSGFLALTVANTQWEARGESPMYGAAAMITARAEATTGVEWDAYDSRIVCANNAIGGTFITEHVKGQPSYQAALGQIAAGKSLANASGKTFGVGAMFWTQGEAATAGYSTILQQLAADFDADARAATGQTQPVLLICSQTPTTLSSALAQLDAHDASNLVWLACPIYQLAFYDTRHINAASSRLLGAYYGLTYHRIAVLGEQWEPLRPLSAVTQGSVIRLRLSVPVGRLVADTAIVPAQPNLGFDLVDAGGAPLTISGVSISGPDTITISAAATIPAGARLRYAHNYPATNKSPLMGGAGNVRDRQGDTITFDSYPLHNWLVTFSIDL